MDCLDCILSVCPAISPNVLHVAAARASLHQGWCHAGTEPAADLPATQMVGRKFRRQLRGAASLLKAPRVRIHKLWD